MKWFFLALTFAFKQFSKSGGEVKNPIEEMKNFMKENALKFLLALTAASVVGSIFVAGLILTVLNLTSQYDLGLMPRVTAIAAGGIGMMVFSIIVFAIASYYSVPHDRSSKKMKKQQSASTLESALVLLVNDFVQEREFKRRNALELAKENSKDYSRGNAATYAEKEEMLKH